MSAVNGMLLAAGHGTRMEPLSSWIAKPALDVLGRPLLASALDLLLGAGCERVVVNLSRHPDQVAAAARDAAAGRVAVRFSWEPSVLGGAGGVAAARPLLGPGAVLAANADVHAELDLAPLLARDRDDRIVLALLPHPDPARWSSVLLDGEGRVTGFAGAGRPSSGAPYLFAGVQLVGERVVAALPHPPAEWRAVWLALIERGALLGAVVTGAWSEAGSPAAYRELVIAALGRASWAHPQATVAPRSRLHSSALGAGCTLATGAVATDSVIFGGATLAAGCRVERCVVAGPVTVAAGEALHDMLVLPDQRVPLQGH